MTHNIAQPMSLQISNHELAEAREYQRDFRRRFLQQAARNLTETVGRRNGKSRLVFYEMMTAISPKDAIMYWLEDEPTG